MKPIKHGKANITALPDLMLRVGARGKPVYAGTLFGSLPKGESRRLRKELRAAGFPNHAAAERVQS